MRILKKIRHFLGSMPLAITILILLAAACALCSTIPQKETIEWYREHYGDRIGSLIIALHADDAYHSGWFIALSGFLCMSLILCNLTRIRQLIRRTRLEKGPDAILKQEPDVEYAGISDPKSVFTRMHMRAIRLGGDENGRKVLTAHRNTAGIWGAWACHLGILLLVVGFALGQITQEEYFIYGVPGETQQLGDTGLQVTINDFRIEWREDGTPGQYIADLTVTDANGRSQSGTSSVNHPANLFGYDLIQNTTGWAANLRILLNGREVQNTPLYVNEFVPIAGMPQYVIWLKDYFPNFDIETKTSLPATASGTNRPYYYYDIIRNRELFLRNLQPEGEELGIGPYTIAFEDARNYALMMVKRDRFDTLTMIGGVIILLGMILAFYLRPESTWAVQNEDGSWTVYGKCRKGSAIFKERFMEAAGSKGGLE